MGRTIPRIKQYIRIPFWYSTHKNRRACGVSLWSERKTIKLLVSGGSCIEAETKVVMLWNPHTQPLGGMGRMSKILN